METRRIVILVSILSFMLGTLVTQIPIFIDASNCNDIPSFHIYYLGRIKQCLEQQDKQLSDRQDATNMYIFNEVKRLDSKIDNSTRTTDTK